jgi:hypothetical protein
MSRASARASRIRAGSSSTASTAYRVARSSIAIFRSSAPCGIGRRVRPLVVRNDRDAPGGVRSESPFAQLIARHDGSLIWLGRGRQCSTAARYCARRCDSGRRSQPDCELGTPLKPLVRSRHRRFVPDPRTGEGGCPALGLTARLAVRARPHTSERNRRRRTELAPLGWRRGLRAGDYPSRLRADELRRT